jgi:hypothetical protein
MSDIVIDIERVAISLHGVSSQVVEEAVTGLEAEVTRRLGSFATRRMSPLHLGDMALSPLSTETVLDASALRALIADRMAEAILRTECASDTNHRETS